MATLATEVPTVGDADIHDVFSVAVRATALLGFAERFVKVRIFFH